MIFYAEGMADVNFVVILRKGACQTERTLDPSPYIFSTNLFGSACFWAVGALSPLLRRVFIISGDCFS